MDKVKKIGIPIVLIGIIIGALSITYHTYIGKQFILFNEITPLTIREVLANTELEVNQNQIQCVMTSETLDGLLLEAVEAFNESETTVEKIQDIHYDMVNKMLYLGVISSKEKYYTFKLNAPLEVTEESICFQVEKCRLGSLNVPVTKGYFRSVSGIEEVIELPIMEQDLVIQLTSIELVENQIVATYTYNEATLQEKFDGYMSQIEPSRVAAHMEKKDINDLFIQIGEDKKADLEVIKECLSIFSNEIEGIKELSFIMNTEGQKAIYNDWNYLFIRNMTLEEWHALSENDMAGALNEYHNTFVKSFYTYLYQHDNYTLSDGTVKVNGSPVDYKAVFLANGYQNYMYDIDLVLEDHKVYAVYDVSNGTAKKQILVRR